MRTKASGGGGGVRGAVQGRQAKAPQAKRGRGTNRATERTQQDR